MRIFVGVPEKYALVACFIVVIGAMSLAKLPIIAPIVKAMTVSAIIFEVNLGSRSLAADIRGGLEDSFQLLVLLRNESFSWAETLFPKGSLSLE